MTCHCVPLTPSLCTCGAVLDITQWHGDDEQGNPLCPTCSGCGCEPEERNNMTPEELDALPVGTELILGGIDRHLKRPNGRWAVLNGNYSSGQIAKAIRGTEHGTD